MALFNMKCPYCNAPMAAEEEWIGMACNCPGCGKKITIAHPQQTQQPTPQYQQNSYTQQPGVNPNSTFYPPQQCKSFIAYLLLAVFLGNLGIHDFYAGYSLKGIIKLLMTLLSCGVLGIVSFVWALFDICTVRHDANGNPLV